jgi:thiosulfate/3-mercaptopyruvate sulfurtransferase
MSDILVSAEWLKERLGQPNVKAVDGSWYLPAEKRDHKAEFLAGHIPGAVFFDIDLIADRDTDLPHMLPSETAFAKAMGDLGLSDSDTIVVYDGIGLFSAPRVWWTLKVFGARDVAVLDGGLPAWKKAGYPLESGLAAPVPASFVTRLNREMVCDMDEVANHLATGGATVVDARSEARFKGELPEPRPGVKPGHIPGSRNLHYERLVNGNGRLVQPERIRALFQFAGADLAKPVVTTCGSGVTAALLAFALARAGKHDVTVYDGSWAEWGSRPNTPIATGEA